MQKLVLSKNHFIKIVFILFLSISGKSQNNSIRIIRPKIGFTPDISENAASSLKRFQKIYFRTDSIVLSYPNKKSAYKKLSKEEIDIYEHFDEFEKEDPFDVGTIGCSYYCAGGPSNITSSSFLYQKRDTIYHPSKIHDFSLKTAWISEFNVKRGFQNITFQFEKERSLVEKVIIFNGFMENEQSWENYSRIKKLRLYVNNKVYADLNLEDVKSKQIFNVGMLEEKNKDMFLRFEILEVYPGRFSDKAAISELEFDSDHHH